MGIHSPKTYMEERETRKFSELSKGHGFFQKGFEISAYVYSLIDFQSCFLDKILPTFIFICVGFLESNPSRQKDFP